MADNAGSSSELERSRSKRPRTDGQAQGEVPNEDHYYRRRYPPQIELYEEKNKDKVRNRTYHEAIFYHTSKIRDKTVLVLGCGTGILSIFCAMAGATKVYAVDAGADIAGKVKTIVAANDLSDVIEVLNKPFEDVQIEEKVDVMVSDWMGQMLIDKDMLSYFITARDSWLKSTGLILPSSAALYVAPFTNPERYRERVDCWLNVSGVNMSYMIPFTKENAFQRPTVDRIKDENLLACSEKVMDIDCYSISIPELAAVRTPFEWVALKRGLVHGFAFWFHAEFSGSSNKMEQQSVMDKLDPVPVLSTAPTDDLTHWEQTLIYFSNSAQLEQGQKFVGEVILSQGIPHKWRMNMKLEYCSENSTTTLTKECVLGGF